MMGFEEYCKKNQYSLNQTRSQAFTLGVASRQAEIDELQNKLDDIVDMVCNNTPDYRIDDMIQEILKGKEKD